MFPLLPRFLPLDSGRAGRAPRGAARFVGVLVTVSALLACTSSSSTSLEDCYAICDRFRSCFDSGYHTGKCYDRCEVAEEDRAFAGATEDCRSCFFNRSCASADDTCSPSCDWIVP